MSAKRSTSLTAPASSMAGRFCFRALRKTSWLTRMCGGSIWARDLHYDFPAGGDVTLFGGSRSAGFGTGPLPLPATHGIILSGAWEGERAGTAVSAERSDGREKT